MNFVTNIIPLDGLEYQCNAMPFLLTVYNTRPLFPWRDSKAMQMQSIFFSKCLIKHSRLVSAVCKWLHLPVNTLKTSSNSGVELE